MMKLMEESSGIGELMLDGAMLCEVRYTVRRFQGMTEGSGLPVPGLHRIEGSIDFDGKSPALDWIGTPVALKLEDGRMFGITIVNTDGRILSEGHGPSKCLCC